MKRTFVFSVWAFISVLGCLAQSGSPVLKTLEIPFGTIVGMSDNGRWAVYDDDNDGVDGGCAVNVYDLTEGTVKKLSDGSEGDNVHLSDISDDGMVVAGSYNNVPAFFKDGRWTVLPMPAGTRGYGGKVSSMTPDASVMVGMIYNSSYNFTSCFWKNGELVPLEGLPTTDISGNENAELNLVAVSSDGNTVLGGLSTNHPGWGCCYFVYDVKTKTYEMLGKNLNSESFIDNVMMSNDGSYVSGNVYLVREIEGAEWPEEKIVPFLYDVHGKTFEMYDGTQDADQFVASVANNGLMFCSTPSGNQVRTMSVRVNGMYIDLGMILKQRYSIDFAKAVGVEYTGTAVAVSDDCKTIVAFPSPQEDNYVLTLPVSFSEAAQGVNVLADYELSPVAGSEIAKVKQVALAFMRDADITEGAKAYIYKGETMVAATSSITPASAKDNRIFVLDFPETAFSEGDEYVLNVPAGTFMSGGMGNNDITAVYKGRAERPVAPVRIAPLEESVITELSYNNPVMITFDTKIAVAQAASAMLLQKDSEQPLSSLVLVANGNRLYIYPPTTRRLMKGTEYVVKIPAGTVCDVVGFCPNEEINVNYHGAFVVTPPEQGSSFLFVDDFNDPGTSLTKWLMYEGDHNNPTPEMEKWGFDADNTPWNFSVRDDGQYDYCAASTSMYSPAGRADDWMITPQLTVGNEYYMLNFQTQSYKKGKADKLKVYVWENDDIIEGTVLKEHVDAIRANGRVVFDGTLAPGENEAALAGEWESHTVSLAEYSGKKIYIAFLNENEGQSVVFVDNVNVIYKGNFVAGNMTTENVVAQEEAEVKGYVRVTNDVTYDAIEATYKTIDGMQSGSYRAEGISLKEGSVYEFTFPEKLKLTKGQETPFSIVVKMGTEEQEVSASVKNLAFNPKRRVVLEEGTGAWCGNCPGGILAVEYIESQFPGQLIPVCIHNDDAYAYGAYESFLGFHSFPTGRVNRIEDYLSYMDSDEEGNPSFFSVAGGVTFADYVKSEIERLADVEIETGEAVYNSSTDEVTVPVDVKFALDKNSVNYNILTVIVEDNLYANQRNYFASRTDPIYGDWGLGGKYGRGSVWYAYKDVARAIIGQSYYGESGYIPTSVRGGETISNTISFEVPQKTVSSLQNCKIVCMLIDAANGYVLNAARCDAISNAAEWDQANGIDDAVADTDAAGASYYNLAGQKVEAQRKGLNIVRLSNGRTVKVIVKQ